MTGPIDDAVDETVQPDTVQPDRRPTPGAQAASRARRIGGRPTPGPRPASGPGSGPRPGSGEDASPYAAAPVPDRTSALRWWPVIAMAVIVLALAGGVAYLGVSRPATTSTSQVRQELLAQAKTKVAAVSSYDYRNLDKSEQNGSVGLIQPFKAIYEKSFSTVVKPLAGQLKAIVTCNIQNAAITSLSPDGKQAVVLIYAQLANQNAGTGTTTPRLDIATIMVTMNKVGGGWSISNLARE